MKMADKDVKDFTTVTDIISECKCIHLGLISEGEPYVVPLSFKCGADCENKKLSLIFEVINGGRLAKMIEEHPTAAFSAQSGSQCVMGRGRIITQTQDEEKVVCRLDAEQLNIKQLSIEQNTKAENNCQTGEAAAADALTAYVDGSYDIVTANFAYGCVILENGREHTMSKAFSDAELATMRNVAGEIKGAEAAMQYALDHGAKELTIYYDYEGIAKWPLGQWKANKEGTVAYREFYREAAKKVKIEFVKVKGHSGDKYNDMADGLAKGALNIK